MSAAGALCFLHIDNADGGNADGTCTCTRSIHIHIIGDGGIGTSELYLLRRPHSHSRCRKSSTFGEPTIPVPLRLSVLRWE